ncbi:MAG: hypothetical protein JRG96_18045 [Deltaproteobacteria bacterium]|nr:hypothetical protein [Deltaproteobacteria bacterium]
MSGALLVELESAPLERCEADLVVAGFFRDERPLRDAAAAIDWRFCGLLSERLSEGVIAGDPGEAVLLPTYGRMRAPRVLLLGLGSRAEYRPPRLVAASRAALKRSIDIGARSLALAPLGVAPDDFARNAELLLSGALASVNEAGASIRARIVLPPGELGAASRAIEELIASGAPSGLVFRSASAPAEPRRASPPGAGPGL